ncbi:MAG: CopG family transcriptional regulator [Gammaproteobacteria bacterium]|nr:CopG family transcriptional regulator [Gammaproteobacteria bacterium]
MGQLTIYLDDESERRLKSAAASAGMPVSRWVARLIQEKTRSEWPTAVREMAGAWQDFPDLEAIREAEAKDIDREAF